jgi:uncharacterized low-complexity protein
LRYCLVWLLLGGCIDDRLVPEGGTVLLEAADRQLVVGSTTAVTVCATDRDGFPVAEGTSVWARADAGGFVETEPAADEGACTEQRFAAEGVADLVTEAGEGGCRTVWYVAPSQPGSVSLDAWSGAINAAGESLTVVDAPAALRTWLNPASLGPDGGTFSVLAEVEGCSGAPLAGATVSVETAEAFYTATPSSVTDAAGVARIVLTTDDDAALTVRVPGTDLSGDLAITVARPTIAVTPSQATWSADLVLTLSGSGLSSSATVRIAGQEAPVLSRQPDGLTVSVPAQVGDDVARLELRNPNGRTAVATFTYLP